VGQKASYSVIPFLGTNLPSQYTNLILSKWLRTLRYGNDFFKLVDSDSYFKSYDKYIKAILSRPGTIVRLAVLSDEPDTALGFSVSEDHTIHYIWCHKDNRNLGIGNSLIPFKVDYITHLTKTGMAIWNKKYPTAKFDPFR
jgi:hypothetical protein